MHYAGIGSRETPQDVLSLMQKIGRALALKEYTLRSGGANGADTAFEQGCDMVEGKKEIFLPWRNFNNHNSELFNVSNEALNMASNLHPAWDKCSQGAQRLHARNCYQILGENLDTPVEFVVCWTKYPKASGGTALGVRLAEENNIPVFNLVNGIDGFREEYKKRFDSGGSSMVER